MATNKTIIQLPAASTLYPDDVFPIQQLGVVTRHISASQLGITPVATILALTSASSANAVAVSNAYTDSAVAGIDLSGYATTAQSAAMSANALSQANVYTQGASASIMSFIGALPPSGATLAQVAAASGNALVQANAYTDSEIAGIDLSSYALVTSLQTTAGNLQAQINTKADSSALSSYALTTVASAMSANALVHANAFTSTVSGNLSTSIAGKINASALTPYALVTSVQTTAGNLVAQINAKADTAALANYLQLTGGTTTGNVSISASNPKISVIHSGGFTGSLQVSGGKLIVARDSSVNKIMIDGVMGSLDGTWFTNGAQIADITDAWDAESNANAYTDAASANIMSYIGSGGTVTAGYVQSASANAYVQSNAFTTTASGNIMAYVGQVTANPPGNYVNLSTAQSISGTKTFVGDVYIDYQVVSPQKVASYRTLESTDYFDLANLISPCERMSNVGSLSVSADFNLAFANFFVMTLTAPLTAGFIGCAGSVSPRAQTVTVIVNQTGNNTIKWRDVQWAGGTAPTLTPSGKDMLNFLSYDGGVTFIGAMSLKDIR